MFVPGNQKGYDDEMAATLSAPIRNGGYRARMIPSPGKSIETEQEANE